MGCLRIMKTLNVRWIGAIQISHSAKCLSPHFLPFLFFIFARSKTCYRSIRVTAGWLLNKIISGPFWCVRTLSLAGMTHFICGHPPETICHLKSICITGDAQSASDRKWTLIYFRGIWGIYQVGCTQTNHYSDFNTESQKHAGLKTGWTLESHGAVPLQHCGANAKRAKGLKGYAVQNDSLHFFSPLLNLYELTFR